MAKQMKAADARAKSPEQLTTQLLELRKSQFNLRFQRATGQNEGLGTVLQTRRDIARIKTILAEKKRSAVKT